MKKDFLESFERMLEQAKAQGIDVVGQTFKIANFAAAIFDCHGGCLSIDDLDVQLYVPPGAIPKEQTQQVYIFVTGTSSVDKHSFSTPVVHCGPPDAVFDKDVVLTMPHCVKDTTSCKFSLSKLSSDGSCDELREGLDVITVVNNDSITFSVNSFCGFGATASPAEGTILKKSMTACRPPFRHSDFEGSSSLSKVISSVFITGSSQHTTELGELRQLGGDLKSNEDQTQTAKRSVEQRNTSVDGNSEVVKSAEERTTYKLPTFRDFSLKKDFLESFERMLEQAKAQGIDVVGQTFKIANFAAAILDCHGGCLFIDDLDVQLYVPPGAIPEEQTQQVYIFVTGTSSVDRHSFLTPFVHCGPPDAVFDKDVVLTMPHCVKDTTSCKFSLSKLSSDGSCDELREGLDVITVVNNDSITFSVNSFCGFGATALSKLSSDGSRELRKGLDVITVVNIDSLITFSVSSFCGFGAKASPAERTILKKSMTAWRPPPFRHSDFEGSSSLSKVISSVFINGSSQHTTELGELRQLGGDLKSNEDQTQTAKRSVEQRNTSADGNSEVVKSAEERTTYSKLPTFRDFCLIMKKDFLESFERMLEQAKAQGIDVVGQTFKIANFAAAIFDCHGGCLSIDDLDVHLYVPPGAIPEEQTQQLYIFVTGTSSVDKHSFSTPVVHCGPPDAVFDKDVVLTMPHCVKDTTSCKFSLSKLSSDGSCDELREGLDVITVVNNDSITFSVNHFCGFGATASPVDGTILEKCMIACVFICEDCLSDDEVKLRLCLVDDLKVNVQEVTAKEKEFGFHLADTESPLIVRKNDRAVVATISNCIETWEISGPESRQWMFHPGLLWRETGASHAQAFPSVTFFAKRCSGSETVSFKARMTVYQEGSEGRDHEVNFSVCAEQGRRLPPVPAVPDRDTRMERTLQTLLNQMPRFPVQFSSVRLRPREKLLLKKLCDLLDVPNPLENDWRKLTKLLFKTDSGGCSVSIDSIRDKAGRERRSPTEIVIDLFFGSHSVEKEEKTMDTLKGALCDMNRKDVEQLVHRFDNNRPV